MLLAMYPLHFHIHNKMLVISFWQESDLGTVVQEINLAILCNIRPHKFLLLFSTMANDT